MLSPEVRDGLTEIFNLGIGRAAAALNTLVGEDVRLSVPRLDLVLRVDVAHRFRRHLPGTICAVRERFAGDIGGDAALLLDEQDSLTLLHALLKHDGALAEITDLEREALAEVGNILLNACLGSVANALDIVITGDIPAFDTGSLDAVLQADGDPPTATVVLIKVEFLLAQRSVVGFIAILLDLRSGATLVQAVERLLGPASS